MQNLRGFNHWFPPSPCCGSIGATPPLKTVLKASRKSPGKSVNLQDAQPHGLHPGAPGPHRQVLGAAFEPQMSIWDPVVLGGCLGCSIWSINSKRRPLRTIWGSSDHGMDRTRHRIKATYTPQPLSPALAPALSARNCQEPGTCCLVARGGVPFFS